VCVCVCVLVFFCHSSSPLNKKCSNTATGTTSTAATTAAAAERIDSSEPFSKEKRTAGDGNVPLTSIRVNSIWEQERDEFLSTYRHIHTSHRILFFLSRKKKRYPNNHKHNVPRRRQQQRTNVDIQFTNTIVAMEQLGEGDPLERCVRWFLSTLNVSMDVPAVLFLEGWEMERVWSKRLSWFRTRVLGHSGCRGRCTVRPVMIVYPIAMWVEDPSSIPRHEKAQHSTCTVYSSRNY